MRENRLLKGWKSLVVMCLALVMTLGYAIPTGGAFAASSVPATGERPGWDFYGNTIADFTDAAAGRYHHKYLSTDDPQSYKYDAFCLNPNMNMQPSAFPQRRIWDAKEAKYASGTPQYPLIDATLANKQSTTYDTNYTPDDDKYIDDVYNKLRKILYYGYMNNAGNFSVSDNDLYDATQLAVYNIAVGGLHTRDELPMNLYAGSGEVATVINTLLDYAYDNSVQSPTNGWMAVGMNVNPGNTGQNLLIGNWGDSITPPAPNPSIKTQVKTNEIANKKGQKITDTVSYENLEVGQTYTLTGKLINKATKEEVKCTVTPKTFTATEANGSVDVEFTNVDASTLNDGDKIVVYEYLHEGEATDRDPIAQHTDLDDDNQTVTVSSSAIIISLSTKVENQYISPAANQSFTDTVTFEGLEEGKTYTIKGVVKNQKDKSDVAAECEPAEVDSSINQHGMQFRGIDASKFNDGDKLVVFEYLYEGTIEETKDFTPEDGNDVAKHEDLTDVAQTVTIVDGQIKLEKTTAATSVKPGDVVPYTITVTNERKVPATVQIVDNPETGLKYVEASDGGVYDSDVNTVVWDGLEVPANGSVSVDVFFSITEDASGKVTNRAHVFEPENPENVLGAYEDASEVKVLGAYDDNTDNGSNKKSKGANTGDDAPLGIAMIVLLAAAGGFEVIRRRRTN